MPAYILAIDMGTSSAKGVAVSREGAVAATAEASYPTLQPHPNWVEQNAADWWEAVVHICGMLWRQGIDPAEIAAITFSGQMEDTLLIDRHGEALGPALLYSDGRAAAEAEELLDALGAERLFKITGNWVDAQTTLAKLCWLRNHQPALLERAAAVLPGAHDFIVFKLTGEAVTDYTTAATTGMLDLHGRCWSREIVTRIGLPEAILPRLVEPHQPAGSVGGGAAAATGLLAGTPVFAGVGDAGAATIGAGAVAPGKAYCYLGTTGWAAAVTEEVRRGAEGLFHLAHPDARYLICIAPVLNAGSPYEWVRDQVAQAPDYDEIERVVGAVPAGSGGLVFLPYLDGERSPFRDPQARGAYFGIRRTTGRAELMRAVLEGVSYALRHVLEEVVGAGGVDRMILIGGGSRSAAWGQILADVFRAQILVPQESASGPAVGAAVSAGIGLGWFSGYDAVESILERSHGQLFTPGEANAATYDHLYHAFRSLYPAVRSIYPMLS